MAKPKFPAHTLVEKLTAAGDTGAAKILGYFGGTTDGVVKVYPTLNDLSVCLHIREADIIHVADATPEELPNGGSVIWVKPDAQVQREVNKRTTVQAGFLAGKIAARMARGPGIAAGGARAAAAQQDPDTWNGDGCGYSVWPCSVDHGACLASNDDPCANTDQYWCQIYSANTCANTCAGNYTCGLECATQYCPTQYCPVTYRCAPTRHTLCACEVFSAFCANR